MALQTSNITLPRDVVTQTIDKVKGISTIAQLSPSTPQLFRDTTHLIFNSTSEAEVVEEGAVKSSYTQTLTPVEAKRVKLVTTTRVTNELIWADEDDRTEIIQHIIEDQADAVARALDYVVYHAVNPKTGATLTGYTSLLTNATAVTSGDDASADIDNLADALINYQINGLALSREFASALRKIRVANTGQRLYPEIPLSLNAGTVDGIPSVTSNTVDGVLITPATGVRAIMGDFNTIKWGMVRDARSELIEYGDPDGAGTDLKNVNQVAYRTESMFAYAVLDPKAFAYLKKATTSSSSATPSV